MVARTQYSHSHGIYTRQCRAESNNEQADNSLLDRECFDGLSSRPLLYRSAGLTLRLVDPAVSAAADEADDIIVVVDMSLCRVTRH